MSSVVASLVVSDFVATTAARDTVDGAVAISGAVVAVASTGCGLKMTLICWTVAS